MAATAGALSASRANAGSTACARSTKSCTAADRAISSTRDGRTPAASPVPSRPPSSGSARGETGKRCSPETRSRMRLVASTVTPGHSSSSAATRGAAPATCSTLSRTSSRRRWLQVTGEQLCHGLDGTLLQPERPRHGWEHEVGIGDRREGHKDHAIGERGGALFAQSARPNGSCPRRPARSRSPSAPRRRAAWRRPPPPRRRGQSGRSGDWAGRSMRAVPAPCGAAGARGDAGARGAASEQSDRRTWRAPGR